MFERVRAYVNFRKEANQQKKNSTVSMDEDLKLALQLQAQFDYEASMEQTRDRPKEPPKSAQVSTKELSLVDPQWEMLDPSPDVRALFLEFNEKYFWGTLAGVEVRWSPRMTLCAGLCVYEGRGGLCSVRLSEPLLKLRPRKDLIETLLHEMIHAYLFVTDRNTDHDGHGPQFQSHMHRLNKLTGTNITIYHNFHDEVDNYRQHWWKCDGPCQNRKPYFGLVKRAMNRAPSPRDPWWGDHQRTCGGTYHKIKEPEGYGKKKNKEEKKKTEVPDNSKKGPDIRSLFNKGTSKDPPNPVSKPGQRETDKIPNLNPVRPPDLTKKGIHTFSDFGIDLNNLDNNGDRQMSDRASQESVVSVHQVVFTGKGHKLGDRGAGGVQNRRIPGLFEPTASTSSNIQHKKVDTPKVNTASSADIKNNVSSDGFVSGDQDNNRTTSGLANNFSDAMSSDDDWIFSQEIDNMTKIDAQGSGRTSSETTLKGSNGDMDFISLSEEESDSILTPTKTKTITPKVSTKEQGSQNLKNKVKRIRLPGMSVSNPASKRSREVSDSDSEDDNNRHKRAKKSNPSHTTGKSGIRSIDKTASLVSIFTDSSNDGFDEPSLRTLTQPSGDRFKTSRSNTTSGNKTTGPSRISNAAPPSGGSGTRTSTDLFMLGSSSGSNLPHAQPTGAATTVPNTNSDVVDLDPWRSCPVCSTKVRESQINRHLDSCLS